MATKLGSPFSKIGEFSSKLIRSPVDLLSNIRPSFESVLGSAHGNRVGENEEINIDYCVLESPVYQEHIYRMALKCINFPMIPGRMQQFRDDFSAEDYKVLRDIFNASLPQHKSALTNLKYSEKDMQAEFGAMLRSLASDEHPYYKKSSFSAGYEDWNVEIQKKLSQYHKANVSSTSASSGKNKEIAAILSVGMDYYKYFLKSVLLYSLKKHAKAKTLLPPFLDQLLLEYEIRHGIDIPHRLLNILQLLYEDWTTRLRKVGSLSPGSGLSIPIHIYTRLALVAQSFGEEFVPSAELTSRADILFNLCDTLSHMIGHYNTCFPKISKYSEPTLRAALSLWRKIELSKNISELIYDVGAQELKNYDLKTVKGLRDLSAVVQQRILEAKTFYYKVLSEFEPSFDLLQTITDIYFPPMLQSVSHVMEYGEFDHQLFGLYFLLNEIDRIVGDFCPNSPVLPLRDLLVDWVKCPYEKTKSWVNHALVNDKFQALDPPKNLHSESVQEVFASCYGALELVKLFELEEHDKLCFWEAVVSSLEYYASSSLKVFQKIAMKMTDASSTGRKESRSLSVFSQTNPGDQPQSNQEVVCRLCVIISNMDASLSQLHVLKMVNTPSTVQDLQHYYVSPAFVDTLELNCKGLFLKIRTEMIDILLEKINQGLYELFRDLGVATADEIKSKTRPLQELLITDMKLFEDLTYVLGDVIIQRYWRVLLNCVENMMDPVSVQIPKITTAEQAEAILAGLKIIKEFMEQNQGSGCLMSHEQHTQQVFELLSFYDASTEILIFEFEKNVGDSSTEAVFRRNAIISILQHRITTDEAAKDFIQKQKRFMEDINNATFGLPKTEALIHVHKATYHPTGKTSVVPLVKFGTMYIFDSNICFYSDGLLSQTVLVLNKERIQRIRRGEKRGVEIQLYGESDLSHTFYARDVSRDQLYSNLVHCWIPEEKDPDCTIFDMTEQRAAEVVKTKFHLTNLEKVVDRFSCTSNLISAGSLIITSHHICFEPALGSATVCIPFRDVAAIRREFFRSIHIAYSYGGAELSLNLGGFFNPDSALSTLQRRWDIISKDVSRADKR